MNDINPIFVFHENGSDGQKAAMDKYFASAPQHLKNATAFLGTKEFFGGATPSYGDFAFFHILDTIAHVKAGFLNAYPELLAFHGRVKGLPQLAKYFAERPQTLGMPGSMINPK
jgi:glutathione S-transferase